MSEDEKEEDFIRIDGDQWTVVKRLGVDQDGEVFILSKRKQTGWKCTRSCLYRCYLLGHFEDFKGTFEDERGCKFAIWEKFYGEVRDDA